MKKNVYYGVGLMIILMIIGGGLIYNYQHKYIKNGQDTTDILKIVEKGDIVALKSLEEQNLKLDKRNYMGYTPLHIAANRGDYKIVRYLMRKGAKVNFSSVGEPFAGVSPLHLAATKGNKRIVLYLLKMGADANATPQYGQFAYMTPLHCAVYSAHHDVVKILLENGADVNAEIKQESPDMPAITSLDIAHQLGFAKIEKVLKKYGGEKNTVTTRYPLHGAIAKGDVKQAKDLLDRGADINAKPKEGPLIGRAPLHLAAELGDAEMVKFLLENKANLQLRADYGATALYLAAKNGHAETAEILIKTGAEVNLSMKKVNASPLQAAANMGDLETVETLVNYGAEINTESPEGVDALWYAVDKGNYEVVEFLDQQGGKINKEYAGGWTLLHLATWKVYPEIVGYLLERGLNPTKATVERNRTPLDLVHKEKGTCRRKADDCEEIIRRLKEKIN